MNPVGYWSRNPFDIRSQWRIVFQVVRGVITHNIDHGNTSLLGVVHIRQRVPQARAKV